MTIPDGAACYFCLGEEADEEGKPLVRDCSCRGDSAGFAHSSCLTKYAEQKCKQADDQDMAAFAEPWEKCNNCKQPFQNQLSIDLVSACYLFAEATYGREGNNKYDKMKVMESLRLKIVALFMLNDYSNEVADEKRRVINHLLSMVDQTKKDYKMSRWIHMPKDSEEYQYYRVLCGEYEGIAHHSLGMMLWGESSEENMKTMIMHLKKARAIYNLVGMTDKAKHLDTMISVHTAKKQTENDQNLSTNVAAELTSGLQKSKDTYEHLLNKLGANSHETIALGLQYARLLWSMSHCIEAERLVTKLSAVSRQVHGPDHKTTIEADELLKKCKERCVYVLPDNKPFQALRYENDGEICVVTGPVAMPRNLEDERMYHIANNLVIPRKGCAVICRGLVSVPHLNGELGEVRDFKSDDTGTGILLAVHFEKKGVMSALVKAENLHIAFELPSKSSA